ncbi:MAG TPA: hypothetical protein VM077_01800 [Candidatus Limnocylindrales bacterium]|nr:hypothetical protein [Candidatus Limnocylindrales bacterium]
MIKNKLFIRLLLAAAFIIPLSISLTSLILGRIPFWYDPARDMILALGNHQKLSLIGQASGIPGIFYGPYWIWAISIVLLISKDPRMVSFVLLTIPYFVLFPFMLYKFRKTLGDLIPVILWLFFILSFNAYSVQIWNPNPAPLLCLAIIYLLVTNEYLSNSRRNIIKLFAAGIFGGLLLNIHISFGLSVIIGSILYLLIFKRLKPLIIFSSGFIVLFIPFFLFEFRHGFNQINTLFKTITSASSVVRESSVDKLQIVELFTKRFSMLVNLPVFFSNILGGLIVFALAISRFKKKIEFSLVERNILVVISTISIALISIYLSTKNPVWEYHFIGVEILFMLFLGIAARKFVVLKYFMLFGVILLTMLSIVKLSREFYLDPYKISSLATKEHIAKTIYDDIGNDKFSVYIFSPATYTPDFDYLLMWEGEKRIKKNMIIDRNSKFAYLIIPWTTDDLRADFIDNRTPNAKYKTIKSWHIADETLIIKRGRYEIK